MKLQMNREALRKLNRQADGESSSDKGDAAQRGLVVLLARGPIEWPSSGQPENPEFYRWMVSALVSIAEWTTFFTSVRALKPKHFLSSPRQA